MKAQSGSNADSEETVITGWVSTVRDLGNIKFLILRSGEGLTQVIFKRGVVAEQLMTLVETLSLEDVVAVRGRAISHPNAPRGIEVRPSDIWVLSKAETPLPMDVSGKITSTLDTRLDWRVLDLRRPENAAVFRIQAKIVEGMEDYLREQGYLQVFTPCLMGAPSESGAEAFPVLYFNKTAFLRQDPQLHRQLLMAAGFDKIFDLGPNWRAEPSHTPRHLCEHHACAVEFAFMEDESDMIRVEEALVVATLQRVKEACADELELLHAAIRIPPRPFPELRFPQIYEVLEELGKPIGYGEDYDRESEMLLWKYVREKYGTDFFFVNRFPFRVKPFYVMRVDDDPRWARSVDLLYKGLELSSGGQREHRYDRIIQQLQEKEMTVESMEWFTKFFKYGVPPHGGFCLGIERLVMQLLNVGNIREVTLFPRTPERMLP
ncbi:aspartyl-tRNA synthetase [miscellaneous Crenarchaeota group archaeon SMTZ1-55]|nr:MAG: aspartyl-tRNA synthetase [miscellaneous Crenarchaeota group archaeon SMTZ1-55]